MSNFDQILHEVNILAESLLDNAEQVKADQVGLDIRAGYRLFVTEDFIAVYKSNAGSLEYYGGFEYVDKQFRTELGEYVFYNREDDRVDTALSTYYGGTEDHDGQPDEAQEWYDFDPDC